MIKQWTLQLLVLTTTLLHAASPFADKPCLSYASPQGPDKKPLELRWGDAPVLDFGSRQVTFDTAGVRKLPQAPAPGVHPRICFTPDDLPDMRRRLKETKCGQAAWKNMLCWTEMMKGCYDDTAEYAKPDVWKGSFGGLRGRVPLFRLGVPREKGFAYNRHPKAAAIYSSLITGTATNFPAFYWNVFSLEAFRCLIEEDAAGAQALAKATMTAMKLDQSVRDAERKAKGLTGPADQPVGGFQLAFIYDFIFNWLTAEQRTAIHAELAACSWHHDNYGTFNEATASRSNWATFSYWLYPVLAIEGEAGFNELKVKGMFRGWRNLYTYGWFQSGATFEGEAKNQLGMDGVIPFAMRQQAYGFDNLCGHPYLRAYATNFLPHSVIPTLDGFIKYDLLGGAHGRPMPPDGLGLKFMFPEDKVIDWVYRSAVGEDYQHVPDRCDGYRNDLLFFLMYAMDFEPQNSDPAKLARGNTFFCGERALLMTRSGWDTNALMLCLHTRQANGGHPFADRNAIQLAGAGRVWSPPGYASFKTPENSLVCIDNKSQDLAVPGRMLDFSDSPLATFAVGDAKYCWDWTWKTLGKSGGAYTLEDVKAGRVEIPPGWQKVSHTINDFSYLKLPFAYLDRPLFEQPHWCLKAGFLSPVVRQPLYPVQKAFRTAGIVRGPHPYALVMDDIQKDDAAHRYDWILTLEKDIAIVKTTQAGGQLDILLKGESSPALLLVRVLAAEGLGVPAIDDFPNQSDPKKYGPVRRLVIPANAVSPAFKVLLYPHAPGAPMPVTTWNRARTEVSVSFNGEADQLLFSAQPSGKTDLMIRRGRQKLIDINRPVAPLKDLLLEQEAARITNIRRELADFNPDALAGRFETPPLPTLAREPGAVAQALRFTGAKEGVVWPVDLRPLTNGFTLVFWARAEPPAGAYVSCNGNRGFSLSLEHGKFLRTDALGQHRWQGNTPLNGDAWHQFAVTVDPAAITLFVDGCVLKTGALEKPLQLASALTLGAGYAGLLDDLRVYTRALSASELERLFNYHTYVKGQRK
jgi:hypothetical protein